MDVKNISTTDISIIVEFFDNTVLEFIIQRNLLKKVILKKGSIVAEIIGADLLDEIGSTRASIKLYNCTSQADFYAYLRAAREKCKDASCLNELGENARSYVFDIVSCQTVNFLYDLRNGKLVQV